MEDFQRLIFIVCDTVQQSCRRQQVDRSSAIFLHRNRSSISTETFHLSPQKSPQAITLKKSGIHNTLFCKILSKSTPLKLCVSIQLLEVHVHHNCLLSLDLSGFEVSKFQPKKAAITQIYIAHCRRDCSDQDIKRCFLISKYAPVLQTSRSHKYMLSYLWV